MTNVALESHIRKIMEGSSEGFSIWSAEEIADQTVDRFLKIINDPETSDTVDEAMQITNPIQIFAVTLHELPLKIALNFENTFQVMAYYRLSEPSVKDASLFSNSQQYGALSCGASVEEALKFETDSQVRAFCAPFPFGQSATEALKFKDAIHLKALHEVLLFQMKNHHAFGSWLVHVHFQILMQLNRPLLLLGLNLILPIWFYLD